MTLVPALSQQAEHVVMFTFHYLRYFDARPRSNSQCARKLLPKNGLTRLLVEECSLQQFLYRQAGTTGAKQTVPSEGYENWFQALTSTAFRTIIIHG